ncbi:hypothetical protein SAMN05421504_104703 [Amycolatopsis xylanica]|uniref:Uncharacterized protein n=1 Tax=Amycolatopsis xylanica TaxID=589385 RepID=A0A1H3HKK2_9PSEU|nr:hypothetical protein [Amycolatopsis xylanica]SDY15900.1 hypothetical protein SAMN05421504_104703 [Amycolatopsis xylanica]
MPDGFDTQSRAEKGTPAGDASGSFLAGIVAEPGPVDAATASVFRSNAEQVKSLAKQGKFAVNEAGGEHAKRAARVYLDGYASMKFGLAQLKEGPALGQGPYAQTVKRHVIGMIDGDQRSLVPAADDMQAGFEALIEAIDIAMRNYRETESAHDQALRKINPAK